MANTVETINARFQELGHDWVEAVSVNDRIKISVKESARKAWKEAGNQRKPTFSKESIEAVAAYINETLTAHTNAWVTCGVDSEVYFQSSGASQVRTPLVVNNDNKPLLRYWDARGRVQALKYLLSDVLGVDGWVDDVLTPSSAEQWKSTLKFDVSYSGPWHTLPAVRFTAKSPLVCQTEAVARYLGAHFGINGANPDDIAQADALLCATYQAVTQISMLSLYATSEEDVNKELTKMRTTYPVYLNTLVEILGDKPFFIDAKQPLYCDYFVLDALQHVVAFIGPKYLTERPSLQAFLERMEARPNIAAQIARTFPKWCYSPSEQANWAIINAKLEQ